MVVFTVHEPPNPAADRVDRAEGLVFLKDGFNWVAAILGPLWLLMQRNWLGLAGYAAAGAAIFGALYLIGASTPAIVLAFVAINIFLGFEGCEIERDSLESKGWAQLGTVSGANLAECERRFFEHWLPAQPVIAYHLGAGVSAQGSVSLATSTPPAPKPSGAPVRGGILRRLGLKRAQ